MSNEPAGKDTSLPWYLKVVILVLLLVVLFVVVVDIMHFASAF
jgi:hypothetical protein